MKKSLIIVPLLLITLSSCTSEAEKIQGDLLQKKEEITNNATTSLEKAKQKVEQGQEAVKSAQDTIKKFEELSQ